MEAGLPAGLGRVHAPGCARSSTLLRLGLPPALGHPSPHTKSWLPCRTGRPPPPSTDQARHGSTAGRYTLAVSRHVTAILEEEVLPRPSCPATGYAVPMGQLLGARKIVTSGPIRAKADRLRRSTPMTDVETAQTLSAISVQCQGDYAGVRSGGTAMATAKLPSQAPPVAPSVNVPPAPPCAVPPADKLRFSKRAARRAGGGLWLASRWGTPVTRRVTPPTGQAQADARAV